MASLRGLTARLRTAAGDKAPAGQPTSAPVVSVVVPVYQARPYLDDCLDSVRGQSYPHLQIVIVDDGSTDGSAQLCARHAQQDARIQVHRQENAGLGAARNVGIARSTGSYLTFLDADDTLPSDAYELLVGELEASGSDFAIGSVQRVTHGRRRTPAWIAEVHERDRRAISIDQFPRAVMDVIACNRMFRRSFWDRARLGFPQGVAYEDHVPMMTAYVRAEAFDVLAATTYFWRIREDESSIGQQKHQVQNLRDRLAAKNGAWQVLAAEASPAVRSAWRTRVLDMDLPLFIDRVPEVDDEYFQVLRAGVAEHLAATDAAALAQVRAERRVKARLVADGRREDLERLLATEPVRGPVGTTTVTGERIVADFPGVVDLPEQLRVLTEHQTGLRATLRRCWWSGPGRLELELSAYIPYVDVREHPARAEGWWVAASSGHRFAAELVAYSDPEITRAAQPTTQSYDSSGLRLSLDVRTLLRSGPPAAGSPCAWHLELAVSCGELTRRGVVRHRVAGGSAGSLRPSSTADGVRYWLESTREHGLTLTAAASLATFRAASVVAGELVLEAVPGGEPVRRLAAVAGPGGPQVAARTTAAPGAVRSGLALDRVLALSPEQRWMLRAYTDEGRSLLAWPPEQDEELLAVPGAGSLVVRRSDTGQALLAVPGPTIEVRSAAVTAESLTLVLRSFGLATRPRLVLRSSDAELALRPVEGGAGASTWTVTAPVAELVEPGEWDLGTDPGTPEVRVRLAPAVLAQLPVLQAGAAIRTLIVRGRGGGLALVREPADWAPPARSGGPAPRSA